MTSLTQKNLGKNPEFSKLLNSLAGRLNKYGIPVEQENKAKDLEIELMEKRKEYFRRKIFNDHICALITNFEEFTNNQGAFNNAFLDSEMFEAKANEGFKKEDFLNPFNVADNKEDKSHVLKQDLEERLKKDLAELSNQLHTSYTALMNHPQDETCAVELPELMRRDFGRMEVSKAALDQKKSSANKAQQNYLQALTSTSSTALEIVDKHLLGSLPCNVGINVDHMDKQVEALTLKLNNMRYGLMDETYSKDVINVLHYISKELSKEIDKTKGESRSSSSLLASYESLGKEFSDMVDKYSKLKDDIENQKWALNEVKKSQN